jgi:bacteriocin biosynthesis cyclodehydratase domain-containing protein
MPFEVPKPVHILCIGNYGKAVGRYLQDFRDDGVVTRIEKGFLPPPSTWPASRMIVAASWRPAPKLYSVLDEFSHKTRRSFIPLYLDSSLLRIGPIVCPGQEGCWHCGMARSLQHAVLAAERKLIWDHYNANPNVGPLGYLEPFAVIGAAQLSTIIDEIDSGRSKGGVIWQIDLLTSQVTVGRVVGIHGCPHCGVRRAAAMRSFDDMQQALLPSCLTMNPESENTSTSIEHSPPFQETSGDATLVPARPRFLHEAVVIPFDDGLLVEGTRVTQSLRGPGTKTLLPDLLPLMDGSRTIDDLARMFPHIPGAEFNAALTLLSECGVLEDGTGLQEAEVANIETLQYLRRYASATGPNKSALAAYRRLRDSA